METASQLEPIGRPPWEEISEEFSYKIENDLLMDQARQRTRSDMSISYIQTALGICEVMNTHITAIGNCVQALKPS
ncbi:hypothetical protein Emed_005799 [Eimeria media]